MNAKERRIMLEFPIALDEAVNEKFKGAKCKTTYDFFGSGNYKTVFKGTGERKKLINTFIVAYIAGNLELQTRLIALK